MKDLDYRIYSLDPKNLEKSVQDALQIFEMREGRQPNILIIHRTHELPELPGITIERDDRAGMLSVLWLGIDPSLAVIADEPIPDGKEPNDSDCSHDYFAA